MTEFLSLVFFSLNLFGSVYFVYLYIFGLEETIGV